MLQDRGIHGRSHHHLRDHLPHHHHLGKLGFLMQALMKSEIQLSEELSTKKGVLRRIRKNSLPKTLWRKKGRLIFYTDKGEHALRNEIMKKILVDASRN